MFVKFSKVIFFKSLNLYNKVNEISITYNYDHVLIYIMCKFHVATSFH